MRHDLDPKYYNIVSIYTIYIISAYIYSFLSINKCNNQLKICIEGSRNTRPKKLLKTIRISHKYALD